MGGSNYTACTITVMRNTPTVSMPQTVAPQTLRSPWTVLFTLNAAVNKTRNLVESQFTTFIRIKQSMRTVRTQLLE
jgi:hypothetical protein